MFLTLSIALTLPADLPEPRLVGELAELKTVGGTLRGTIDLPAGKGPWPVVLLHAGSGPTDRDGNSILARNDCLKMVGRSLAARGIAVLRIDKRGIAGSANALSREEDLRLETYAVDVTAWVALLRQDRRFTKVGFVGHSEGALIGLIAAKEARFDAFVSLCGLTRRYQDLLREQLKNNLPKDLYEASEKIIDELEAGREVKDKDIPKPLAPLFRPSIQPYLISAFRIDPLKLAAAYPGPLLAVSGTTDIQVPVADGKKLTEARPGAKHVVIDGMNHVLKPVARTERLFQLPSYSDPSLPLHPKLADELAGFLRPALGKD